MIIFNICFFTTVHFISLPVNPKILRIMTWKVALVLSLSITNLSSLVDSKHPLIQKHPAISSLSLSSFSCPQSFPCYQTFSEIAEFFSEVAGGMEFQLSALAPSWKKIQVDLSEWITSLISPWTPKIFQHHSSKSTKFFRHPGLLCCPTSHIWLHTWPQENHSLTRVISVGVWCCLCWRGSSRLIMNFFSRASASLLS